MHRWDEATDLLAASVIGYAVERLKTPKDPTWGARPADELAAVLAGTITPDGIGGHAALALFRDVLLHACRPMDSPLHLRTWRPRRRLRTCSTSSLTASSIFGGMWEGGAGDRRRERGAALARRPGRAPCRRRRVLRRRRLGGQPVGARHGPPPRQGSGGGPTGAVVGGDDGRDPHVPCTRRG